MYVTFAYQNDGECAYDHVDVFTEFSGSTCAESAVESVINHMNPKPTLNFCYSADIKSGCRKVGYVNTLRPRLFETYKQTLSLLCQLRGFCFFLSSNDANCQCTKIQHRAVLVISLISYHQRLSNKFF